MRSPASCRMRFCALLGLLLCGLLPALAQWIPEEQTPISCFTPHVLMSKGVPMIALEPLVEVLGASLTVDAKMQTVTVTRLERTFTCTFTTTAAESNGKAIILPCAPVLTPDLFFVPFIPVIGALGGSRKVEPPDPADNTMDYRFAGDPAFDVEFTVDHLGDKTALGQCGTQYYTINTNGTGLRALSSSAHGTSAITVTPDAHALYYVQENLFLFEREMNAHAPQLLTTLHSDWVNRDICVSPDGRTVLLVQARPRAYGEPYQESHLYIVKDDGKALQQIAEGYNPCFSPDGTRLAVTAWDAERKIPVIRVLNADGTNPVTLGEGIKPIFSPDGKYLAWMRCDKWTIKRRNGAVMICPVLSDNPTRDTRTVYQGVGLAYLTADPRSRWGSFSPDGKQLAFTTADRRVFLANADGTGQRVIYTLGMNSGPQFTPDGKNLILIGGRDANTLVRVPTNGDRAQELTRGLEVPDFLLLPDGNRLIFQGFRP